MTSLQLGAGRHVIDDPAGHVERYLDEGYVSRGGYYYRGSRGEDGSRISHEAFTLSCMIVGSHVGRRAISFHQRGGELNLRTVPTTPLQATGVAERRALSDAITAVGAWDGFAASAASKLLHPTRPAGIPVLDRESIGGAYVSATWSGRAISRSILYRELPGVLGLYYDDLTQPGNREGWSVLERYTRGEFTRLQLLDMVWWVHYRNTSLLRS